MIIRIPPVAKFLFSIFTQLLWLNNWRTTEEADTHNLTEKKAISSLNHLNNVNASPGESFHVLVSLKTQSGAEI